MTEDLDVKVDGRGAAQSGLTMLPNLAGNCVVWQPPPRLVRKFNIAALLTLRDGAASLSGPICAALNAADARTVAAALLAMADAAEGTE